jgi:hypothetical protein
MPVPTHIPTWLILNPHRRCQAHSKQARRQCRRVATPGYKVCASHGSRSRGRYVIRWDCRPSAVPKKVAQARAYAIRQGADASQSMPWSAPRSAQVLTSAEIEALMTSTGRS